jgi:iron complex outermembrane receptor protein
MKTKLLGGSAIVALLALGAVQTAEAQTAEGGTALEEVVVTAQKRAENLQEVPITIAAFNQQALEKQNIYTLGDIGNKIPALLIRPLANAPANLQFVLRGVQPIAPDITQDSQLGIYINGMYIARASGLDLATADVERIEVLKGPQGSLYGRNAVAGAINIITPKPIMDEYHASAQGTVGSRNLYLGKATLNIPVGETFAIRAAGFYRQQDGFIRNSTPQFGDWNFEDKTSYSLRFDARWKPTDSLTVDYGADYGKMRYKSTGAQCFEINPNPTGAAFGSAQGAVCSWDRLNALPASYDLPRSVVSAQDHQLNVEWAGDSITLRSITGYRHMKDAIRFILNNQGPTGFRLDTGPSGYAPFDVIPGRATRTDQEQYSQEVQALGSIGETFDYVVGAIWFRESVAENTGLPFSHSLSVPINRAIIPTVPIGSRLISLQGRGAKAKSESKALFGQLTWRPIERVEVVADLRYTWDSRQAAYTSLSSASFIVTPTGQLLTTTGQPTTFTPAYTSGSGDLKFHKFNPGVTVQYHVNGDVMVYGKVVTGYRAGGFNGRAFNATDFAQGFGPENVTNYEAGLKGEFWNRRLRFNAALYHAKFKDQQVALTCTPNITGCSKVINAGKSHTKGFEWEVVLAPVEGLTLSANYAYVDAGFDKVTDPNFGDVTSQFFFRNPKQSWNAAIDYDFPQTPIGRPNLNVTYSYATKWLAGFTGAINTRADDYFGTSPGYGLIDARLSLRDIPVANGNAQVAFWVKNLADKNYKAFVYGRDPQLTNFYGYWGAPRSVGLDVSYKY